MNNRCLIVGVLSAILFAGCAAALPTTDSADSWLTHIAGHYHGHIFSSGLNADSTTELFPVQQGVIRGRYVFVEAEKNQYGQLTCKEESTLRLQCEWRDNYGYGALHLTFDEAFTHFNGYWYPKNNSRDRYPWVGTK